jgi:ArsR family transcriptional regulator
LIYLAEYDAMNALLAYLTENCCQGDRAACDATNLVKPRRSIRQ